MKLGVFLINADTRVDKDEKSHIFLDASTRLDENVALNDRVFPGRTKSARGSWHNPSRIFTWSSYASERGEGGQKRPVERTANVLDEIIAMLGGNGHKRKRDT